MDIESGDDL